MAVDVENDNLIEAQGFYSSVTMESGDVIYVQPITGGSPSGSVFGHVWGVIAARNVDVHWTLAAVPVAADWFDHIDSPVPARGMGLPLTYNGVEFYRITAKGSITVYIKTRTRHRILEAL